MEKNFETLEVDAYYQDRTGVTHKIIKTMPHTLDSHVVFISDRSRHFYSSGKVHLGIETGGDLVQRVTVTPYPKEMPSETKSLRKVEDLKGNDCIACYSEEEADTITKLLCQISPRHKEVYGAYHWGATKESPRLFSPVHLGFYTLTHAQEEGYNIYPASDFLPGESVADDLPKIDLKDHESMRFNHLKGFEIYREEIRKMNVANTPALSECKYEAYVREFFALRKDFDINKPIPEGSDFTQLVGLLCGFDQLRKATAEQPPKPYWMVQLVGAGEPSYRHPSEGSAMVEAERLLNCQHIMRGQPIGGVVTCTKAIVTKHYPVERVAHLTASLETKIVGINTEHLSGEPAIGDDLPF